MFVKCIFTGKSYNLNTVAKALKAKGLDTSKEYENEKGQLIDMTMSCDKEEALDFLVGHTCRTVALSTGSMDASKRVEFLAAYDLATSLDPLVFV